MVTKLPEGGSERLAGKEERTEFVEVRRRCVTWSGRWAARPMSRRSWDTGFGRGGDVARRLRP